MVVCLLGMKVCWHVAVGMMIMRVAILVVIVVCIAVVVPIGLTRVIYQAHLA